MTSDGQQRLADLDRPQRQLRAGLRSDESARERRVRADAEPELREERADDALCRPTCREGFGVRTYNWEGSASIQHELMPRPVGERLLQPAMVRQLPRSTQNLLVTNADFSPYCVTGAARSAAAGRRRQPGVRLLRRQPDEARAERQRDQPGVAFRHAGGGVRRLRRRRAACGCRAASSFSGGVTHRAARGPTPAT